MKSTIIVYLSILSGVAILQACDQDGFDIPTPLVFLEDGVDSEPVSINEMISKIAVVGASAGLKSLEVLRNGDDFDFIDYGAGQFRERYTLEYTVDNSVPVGQVITFSFIATDVNNHISKTLAYEIIVVEAQKFVITQEDLSGVAVNQISPLPGVANALINADLTLDAAQPWLLNGPVLVEPGNTLTIAPGTTIYAKRFADTDNSYLAVQQGARIQAVGTKNEPIVLTSERVLTDNAAHGDWAGLLVLGAARTNLGENVQIPNAGTFGGRDDHDNSGRISYVRVEYAGKSFDANFSGAITLQAVGSETQVDHIQGIFSDKSGVQVYGGTVNIKYLVAVDCFDHMVNARHGWRGKGQFWITQAPTDRDIDDPRAIDVRNFTDNKDAEPRTNPMLSNFTLLGPGLDQKDAGLNNRGLRIREGAAGKFHNFLITEFPDDALRIDNEQSALLSNGNLVVQNGYVWNNDNDFVRLAGGLKDNPDNKLFDTPVDGVGVDQFVGSTTSEALEPAALDPWFEAATFAGAVENEANDWTADGEWCKNQEGTVR